MYVMLRPRIRSRRTPRLPARRGFTLIELLVVIGIMLLLAGLTLAVYTNTVGSDRIRSASRATQSVLLGARDRAAQAKALRGLRLIHDSDNNNIISAFQYVQPIAIQSYPKGTIQLEREDANGDSSADTADITIVRGLNVDWTNLNSRGALSSPLRVRIPSASLSPPAAVAGRWYTYTLPTAPPPTPGGGETIMRLTTGYQGMGTPAANPAVVAFPRTAADEPTSCDLEMANQFLPNSQPILLPSSTVIFLTRSYNVPADWTTSPNAMDIMFSPRGWITGSVSAGGPIFLYVCDRADAEKNLDPVVAKGEKMILALFPQTGSVATFPVDLTDSNNDNIADDPFLRAKKGAIAGK